MDLSEPRCVVTSATLGLFILSCFIMQGNAVHTRSKKTLSAELQALRGTLPVAPPFDFAHTLALLQRYGPFRGEQLLTDNGLNKAISIDGRAVVLGFTNTGTPDAPSAEYEIFSGSRLSAAQRARALGQLDFFLGLSEELQLFYALALGDPDLAPVVQKLYGYRQIRFPSPFEAAAWAILSQHNHMSIASSMKRKLADALGPQLLVEGAELVAFPEAPAVAAAEPGHLLHLVRNERRAQYLYETAWAFKEVPEEFLRAAAYAEVQRWLLSLPGIGPWSAQLVLLRGLGRVGPTAFADPPLLRAAHDVYGDRIINRETVRYIARSYHPYEALWANYLRTNHWLQRHEHRHRNKAKLNNKLFQE